MPTLRELDDMFLSQASVYETACFFGVSEQSLRNYMCKSFNITNCDEYAQAVQIKGRAALRVKQWDLAIKGNVGMLIWLGKQLLDQKDASGDEREYNAARKAFAGVNLNDIARNS